MKKKRHGRRLCRACGYDMVGIVTTTCPECGRTAASEHELLTRRSRRWVRVAGIVLIVTGWVGMYTPGLLKHGWPALVPDYALAYWGPIAASDPTRSLLGSARRQRALGLRAAPPGVPGAVPGIKRTISERVQDALYNETNRRLLDRAISDRLVFHYLCRVHALDPDDTASSVRTPGAWPRGKRFSVWHEEPNLNDSPFPLQCFTFLRGTMGNGATFVYVDIAANIGGLRHALVQVERPIDTSRTVAEFMRPLTDPAVDAAVAAALNPRLVIIGNDAKLALDQRTDSPPWRAVDCFVTFRVSVLLDGEEVATCECDASRKPTPGLDRLPPLLMWNEGAEDRAIAHPERVELVLTGVPVMAVNEYIKDSWMFEPRAWAGTVRLKPRVEHR